MAIIFDLIDNTRKAAQIRAVQLKASPDTSDPLKEKQLPESTIISDTYLFAAEDKVLTDTNMSEADISALDKESREYKRLVQLVTIQLAMMFYIPQVIREGDTEDNNTYESIERADKLAEFQAEYDDILDLVTPAETDKPKYETRVFISSY